VILLDTHVALWLALEPASISRAAVSVIEVAQGEGSGIGLSCVSLYEITRVAHRGGIQLDGPVEDFLDQLSARLSIIGLTSSIALAAARLPADFIGDPIDRIIAATALTEGIPLVTADQNIRRSRSVKTIW
jgi:PIN domain nuclease of toxin-antitoxin system